jgi:hypothetical protein
MDDPHQSSPPDRSESDADERFADIEKEFEAFTTAFKNRKIYTELNDEIIRSIPDEHLIQAIVDFVGLRIGKDWEHDVERIPPLGPGFSAVYFLSLLETEVSNGGFNQMFYNNGRQAVIQAREGAELVGLETLASVIKQALVVEESMRGKLASAKENGTIEAFMATYDDDADFEAIDDEYSNLTNTIENALIRFIRDKSKMFSGRANG